MKELLPFRLQNKNTYLFVNKLDFKYMMLSHPLLIKHLFVNEADAENDNEDNLYYRQKPTT